MPLGLDYEDLAVGATSARQIMDDADKARINELALRESLRQFKQAQFNDLFANELAPVKFMADKAQLTQKIQPINWERLAAIVRDRGPEAIAEAVAMQRKNYSAQNKDITPNINKFATPTDPNYGSVGGTARGIVDDYGTGKEPNDVTPNEELEFEYIKALAGEKADAKNPKGKGKGKPKLKLQLKGKGAGRTPQSEEELTPDDEAAFNQIRASVNPEAIVLPQAQPKPRWVPEKSPYSMDNLSLAKMAGQIDPTSYIGEQELGLAEKMIAAESNAQAMALRSMQGANTTKSQAEVELGKLQAELAVKAALAENESDRKVWEAKLEVIGKLLNTIVGNKTEQPRVGRGGSQKDPVEAEWKMLNQNEQNAFRGIDPYNVYQKNQIFKDKILPMLQPGGIKYPQNFERFFNKWRKQAEKYGIQPNGNKTVVPKKSAGLQEGSGSATLSSKIGNMKSQAGVYQTLDFNLKKFKVVPRAMFEEAASQAIEQGLHPDDVEALRQKYADKIQ